MVASAFPTPVGFHRAFCGVRSPKLRASPRPILASAVKTLVADGYAAADSTAEHPKVDCAKTRGNQNYICAERTECHPLYFFGGQPCKRVWLPYHFGPHHPPLWLANDQRPENVPPLLSRLGWIQDYPHPKNWLSIYWTCNGFAARTPVIAITSLMR